MRQHPMLPVALVWDRAGKNYGSEGAATSIRGIPKTP
jgi:hypothetical protein